jgi:hypothetical protein
VVVALASPPAQPSYEVQPNPARKPNIVAQCEAAGPDLSSEWPRPCHAEFDSLYLIFLNMFIYINSCSIAKFTFNYNLWHYVKKVLNFMVDELMYAGESNTSRLIFWLGISGLIALCLYSHVTYENNVTDICTIYFLWKNKLKNVVF